MTSTIHFERDDVYKLLVKKNNFATLASNNIDHSSKTKCGSSRWTKHLSQKVENAGIVYILYYFETNEILKESININNEII